MGIFLPMITLLLYIVVESSERTLMEINQSKPLPGLTVRKAIQKIIVQLRKHIATMYPTPFSKYFRKRTSVKRVKEIDRYKNFQRLLMYIGNGYGEKDERYSPGLT